MQADFDNEIIDNKLATEDVSIGKKMVLGVTLALLLSVGTFFSGLMIGGGSGASIPSGNQEASLLSWLFGSKKTTPSNEVNMDEFWRVWNLMDEKFAKTDGGGVSPQAKLEGAIAGMVRAYDDPYTVFLPKEDASALGEDISGNFSGVGMEVGMRDGLITVIAPLPDTPAEKAGIASGDIIVSVDGESTENMTVDKAVNLIRGEAGTEVLIGIVRAGALAIEEFKVTRANIEVPTVKVEQQGDTFIISLYSFNALAESKMQEALRQYVSSDSTKLVIDLRDNPGGYLQSAVNIAGFFLPSGKVVLRESFGDGRKEDVYRSPGKNVKEFGPGEIVVLINGGSASASEILAGALQEHGYATLIGVNSFGKGSVQELVSLDEGTALKVTVARWLTPDGTSISEGGLTPDIIIRRTIEQRQNDEDPQLKAAVDYLAGKEVKSEENGNGGLEDEG